MNQLKKFTNTVSDTWFYERPHPILIVLGIYINGDAIVLIPFIAGILLISFYSFQWMLIVAAIYFSLRNLGEMIYWLLQQFGDRKYRPRDLGFKHLSNNSLYILYQLISLIGLIGWSSVLLFLIKLYLL